MEMVAIVVAVSGTVADVLVNVDSMVDGSNISVDLLVAISNVIVVGVVIVVSSMSFVLVFTGTLVIVADASLPRVELSVGLDVCSVALLLIVAIVGLVLIGVLFVLWLNVFDDFPLVTSVGLFSVNFVDLLVVKATVGVGVLLVVFSVDIVAGVTVVDFLVGIVGTSERNNSHMALPVTRLVLQKNDIKRSFAFIDVYYKLTPCLRILCFSRSRASPP